MKKIFTGICTALITPFEKNLEIDYEAMREIIENQIENGINAICIMGTSGEGSTLTFDEKVAVVRYSLNVVNNRVPVIFGIGGNNPTEILKMGKMIKEFGVGYNASVMLTAPYYNKCTQDAAVKHFAAMSRGIGLPMIVYNIPSRTGMNLEVKTLAKIAKLKHVFGIKESSGNITQIADVVRAVPNCAVYCGDDGLSLPCYSVGCRGLVSVASNIRLNETAEIWRKFLARENKSAAEIFHAEQKYYRALFCEINPGPIKYAMHLGGWCSPFCRPPLTTLCEKSILDYGFRALFKRIGNRKQNRNR